MVLARAPCMFTIISCPSHVHMVNRCQRVGTAPEQSALLKAGESEMEIRRWLMEMKDQVVILTGALIIMHPDMYVTGQEAMVWLGNWAKEQGKESMLNAITMWPTIYNMALVMVNWASPLHLD